MSNRPTNIADCSTEQLIELATDLRAICKTHRWEDLMRHLDALIEMESKDILIAGLEMINTVILCRQTKLQHKLDKLQDTMDVKLALLHADAHVAATVYP
jgi:hypothetical protein